MIPPHSQEIITLDAKGWKRSRSRDGSRPIWILPLSVKSRIGDAWITILETPSDRVLFGLYGATPPDTPPEGLLHDHNVDKIVRAISGVRCLEWSEFEPAVGHARRSVLPAGAYQLKVKLFSKQPEKVRLTVCGLDVPQLWGGVEIVSEVGTGNTDLTLQFHKPFAPYEIAIKIESEGGEVHPLRCTLKPDAAALFSDLKGWEDEGNRPVWLEKASASNVLGQAAPSLTHIAFERNLIIRDIKLPETVKSGAWVVGVMSLDLLDREFGNIWEYHFFLHLYDKIGNQVHANGCQLTYALAASAQGQCFTFDKPIELPTGDYQVRLGVWNGRTGERLTLKPEGPFASRIHHKYIDCFELTVTE